MTGSIRARGSRVRSDLGTWGAHIGLDNWFGWLSVAVSEREKRPGRFVADQSVPVRRSHERPGLKLADRRGGRGVEVRYLG